jgi:hypothetical protein
MGRGSRLEVSLLVAACRWMRGGLSASGKLLVEMRYLLYENEDCQPPSTLLHGHLHVMRSNETSFHHVIFNNADEHAHTSQKFNDQDMVPSVLSDDSLVMPTLFRGISLRGCFVCVSAFSNCYFLHITSSIPEEGCVL